MENDIRQRLAANPTQLVQSLVLAWFAVATGPSAGEVDARTEAPAGAGEDDGPDAVVLVELPGDGQDFIAEHSVQGIELVGPVQRHHGNPVPPLEQQVGVGHERRTRLERRNRPMPMTPA